MRVCGQTYIKRDKELNKGSFGEKMRKVGDKGAPTRAQMQRAKNS